MVPTLAPFFFHWYAGVIPGFVTFELKVALFPAQTAPDGVFVMEMPAVTFVLTLKVVSLVTP